MKVEEWPSKLGFDVGPFAEVWKLGQNANSGLYAFGIRVFNRQQEAQKYVKCYNKISCPIDQDLIEMARSCRQSGTPIETHWKSRSEGKSDED